MRPTICRVLILFSPALIAIGIKAQKVETDRGINQAMLKVIKNDIEDRYLPTNPSSIDLEEKYKNAYELIGKSRSNVEMSKIVGLFILELNDSRLFLLPQLKNVKYDYQWSLKLVGDVVYVKDLDAKSDAYAKGIRPGDRVYMLEGYVLSRENFWKVKNLYDVLSPQDSLELIVIKPDGKKYKFVIKPKTVQTFVQAEFAGTVSRDIKIADETTFEEKGQPRFYDKIEGLTVCRFPSFLVQPIAISKLLNRTDGNRNLILDLRGVGGVASKAWELAIRVNRDNQTYLPRNATRAFMEVQKEAIDLDGGELQTLRLLTASLFQPNMVIGELRERKEVEELKATSTKGSGAFAGKIVVLVDGETSGAAEILARLVQIEKRGMVIGDMTAGRFVKTDFITQKSGITFPSPFGLQVPTAEIVMKNGDRLNGRGVVPDQIVLPTAADFVNGRDPVMSRAADLLNVKLTSDEAGQIFSKRK